MKHRAVIHSAISRVKTRLKPYASAALWVLALLALTACGLKTSAASVSSALPSISADSECDPSAVVVFHAQPQDMPEPAAQRVEDVGEPAASLAVLNQQYAAYGSITISGMEGSDYAEAMAITWTDIETPGEPVHYDIDISELMDYETIERYILNLGRYDGVQVTVIGKSEMGRNIYMVKLDMANETAADKPLIMLTGSVHAREFAGVEYTVKFLNDTLAKAQTDAYTRALLGSVTIVAVPLVNPDGREMIISGGDPSRKSNARGIDLNRAMPSVNAGQLAAGVNLAENFSVVPGMDFFAGNRLGTASETQAMIKWMHVYVPQATAYIDLHQQGGISLYDKSFTSSESDAACREFAEAVNELLHGGYELEEESEYYSLDGDGGTMTDYARSISEGFVFSRRLGRMALSMDGDEVPLICFGDIDSCIEYYQPLNPGFMCMTIEIGRRPSYLGADEGARERREREYERFGWENFLAGTIEYVLGEDTVDQIKSET